MKRGMASALVLALILGLVLTNAWAGEKKAKEVTLTGTVSVVKDDDDNITAVSLTADGEAYTVVLDSKGKKLGEDMDGKNVEVKGTVEEEDGNKMLKVSEYKEVKEEAAEEDAGDAEEAPEW